MKNIKKIFAGLTLTAILLVGINNAFAKKVTFSGSSGLDLYAVAELVKESNNLETFERLLNDPETGINNLDLDEDDEVDYIRVEEQVEEDTHLVILQTELDENETQDVAAIVMEKESDENFNMQILGDPVIYGENYYIVPAYTNIHTWRIVNWIYRPVYRPYRSVFGWRVYPTWWRVRRPVTVNVYRTRTVNFVGRKNFVRSNTIRVKSYATVNYRPKTSTLVKKKKVVVKNGNTKVVKKSVKKTTKTKNVKKTTTKVKVKKKRT